MLMSYSANSRAVKGKKLKEGMRLHFPAQPHLDLLIDSVNETRDGKVLVRCGYSRGDDSSTMFFDLEERVLVLNT